MRCLLFWLLLLTPTAVLAAPPTQPVMMPLGSGPDSVAAGTARMVGAILEYTRWPSPRPVVRLCLAGVTRHAGRLAGIDLSNGVRVELAKLDGQGVVAPDRCDALYIGRVGAAPMRSLIASLRDQAIVTIAEDDPDCRSGAMFCLLYGETSLSFQLSIDAVSRSAVKIDPRVLRLSKGGY
ncbi:YfiR family protein [Sphingobium sp. BYY-5]|uniref:YfiR family protein n=1 Tax=Sphingobium sp. BYY-5 TaxID=2926400 RepID=UPI001FA70994|nr:YfiR family protein [Sphingobium sp. BYY-5]MCI4590253.1 YfiR family protein [Sphingobium sp. BYY-5]